MSRPAALSLFFGLALVANADEPTVVRRIPVAGAAAPQAGGVMSLQAVERLALEHNPILRQAAFGVEAARGKALQASLYPNPKLSVTGDELGDSQGPGGIWAAPVFEQEVVTGGKRRLSTAAACKEIDRAGLAVLTRQYALLGEIRQAYFELAQLQLQATLLRQSIELAEPLVEQSKILLRANQVARLDVATLELELESLRTDAEAVARETDPARARLAALVGVAGLEGAVAGIDLHAAPPDYDLERVYAAVLEHHPEVREAETVCAAARLALERARAEPIPNVTLQAGYVRQNQNRSHDWMLGVALPLPTFDRNQGNIRAAQAAVGEAEQGVAKVRNDLRDRMATAFRRYAANRRTAENLSAKVLPLAQEAYDLSNRAYRRGQADYVKVLEAQRAFVQAKLKRGAALGEAWKAAAQLSALALEDEWPVGKADAVDIK